EDAVSLPSTAIEDEELRGHVVLTLQSLPEADRVLLEAYPGREETPSVIAAEMGRKAANVRHAVHLAMKRLRAILPASIALGVAGLSTSPGWARLRGHVIRASAEHRQRSGTGKVAAASEKLTGTVASSSLTTWIGSIAMTQKLALGLDCYWA
ncbi:MAG: hypothetical protein ACI841_005206, partial [Planctomycetota bacterium]